MGTWVDQSYYRTRRATGAWARTRSTRLWIWHLKDRQHLDIQPRRVTKPPWVNRLEENEVIQVSARTSQGERLVNPQQGWIAFQQGVRGIGRWDGKAIFRCIVACDSWLNQCNKRMFHALENHGEMSHTCRVCRPG